MVNKPFWHISDFVLVSYTFDCVKMSDFVAAPIETTCRNWFRRFKDGDFDVEDRKMAWFVDSIKRWTLLP